MSRSPHAQLAWLSVAMFFGMTLWFSATAANAPIVAEFHLSSSQTAWLTMAVQGGFVIGTLISALGNLPDVVNPRRLFAVGCVIAAIANAALVRADGAATLIAL
ncbi:MAG: major facilitator superfamily 1, partial [Acidobacteria bacterium]|nr:major facilitator superfamily 1 [Acidobacteriota bacterium]